MKKILVIFFICTLFMISTKPVEASFVDTSVPYKTYTMGPNNQFILTQTAYQPAGYFNVTQTLQNPLDMVIFNEVLYILNSGSKEILLYDLDQTFIRAISFSGFVTPSGIDVDENYIYVADKGEKAIFIFDHFGVLINTFYRPTEPIFGLNSPFVPTKIEVGPRGVMYIIGEGSTSGVIQLSSRGEFLGYFATNRASNSWLDTLSDLLGVQYALNVPSSATHLKMDLEGSLYTISPTDQKPLKRFNIASVDTLTVDFFTGFLEALTVSNTGNIITLSSNGFITEYDPFGRLIFTFGGLDPNSNRVSGLLVFPVAIEVSTKNVIYVLDTGLQAVVMYVPTSFTQTIHEGLVSFNDGIFDTQLWQNVLSFNEMFALANQALGQAHYRQANYNEALKYFELAQYKDGYSNTFWQIRYAFLQRDLGIVLMSLAFVFVSLKVLKKVDVHYEIYAPIRKVKAHLLSVKILRELTLLFHMIKHPIDTLYDIKHRHKSSYTSANIIYVIFIIMTIIASILPSFLFRDSTIEEFSLIRHVGIYGIVIILIVFSNYLIATLNDGEGFFKDIYIGFAHSLSPFILMTIPLVILSYGLTLFELFIYQFLWTFTYAITVMYTLIMIKEMHGYNIRALIKNIVLTVFTLFLTILLIFITYLLLNQVFDYVSSLIREVAARV